MKKLTAISLFIFFAVVVSILTASLIFYQNSKTNKLSSGVTNTEIGTNDKAIENQTATSSISTTSPVTRPSIVAAPSSATTGTSLNLNMSEVSKHNKSTDCWQVINNKVYNLISFLNSHPGGVASMSPYCGKEATQAYNTKDIGRPHSSGAQSMLASYYIGTLNQQTTVQQVQQSVQTTNTVVAPTRGGEFEDD